MVWFESREQQSLTNPSKPADFPAADTAVGAQEQDQPEGEYQQKSQGERGNGNWGMEILAPAGTAMFHATL